MLIRMQWFARNDPVDRSDRNGDALWSPAKMAAVCEMDTALRPQHLRQPIRVADAESASSTQYNLFMLRFGALVIPVSACDGRPSASYAMTRVLGSDVGLFTLRGTRTLSANRAAGRIDTDVQFHSEEWFGTDAGLVRLAAEKFEPRRTCKKRLCPDVRTGLGHDRTP
jgi:hypothetical protein